MSVMQYPKLVALDTDGTIFTGQLDQLWWGKGTDAYQTLEDNIEPIDDFCLRDRSNYANHINLNKDVPGIVTKILQNGALLAIVSRNTSKALCDRALYYFKSVDPNTKEEKSIINMVKYDEVLDEPINKHFENIRGWCKFAYSDMVLFDDQYENAEALKEKKYAVSVTICDSKVGLTRATYEAGIERWRRAHQSDQNPESNPGLIHSRTPASDLLGLRLLEHSVVYAIQSYVSGRKSLGDATERESLSTFFNSFVINSEIGAFFPNQSISESSLKDVEGWAQIEKYETDLKNTPLEDPSWDDLIKSLDSMIDNIPKDHPNLHKLLFSLGRTLLFRIQMSITSPSVEPVDLVRLNRIWARSFYLFRQAIYISPNVHGIRVKYIWYLGKTTCIWREILAQDWSPEAFQVLFKFEARVQIDREDPASKRVTGIIANFSMLSSILAAYRTTQDEKYLQEGKVGYQQILSSMSKDSGDLITSTLSSFDTAQRFQALGFFINDLMLFIVRCLDYAMKNLVDAPLSAIFGRYIAALGVQNNFVSRGVEWLDDFLTLAWSQQNVRISMSAMDDQSRRTKQQNQVPADKTEQPIVAFLGLIAYTDYQASNGSSVLQNPEEWAYLLLEQFSIILKETYNPIYRNQSMLKPSLWNRILQNNKSFGAPVVMLNLWGKQCSALVLLGMGEFKCITFQDVTDEYVTGLHDKFHAAMASQQRLLSLTGIATKGVGNSTGASHELSNVHRALASLWEKIVKPILDLLGLSPFKKSSQKPDFPQLIWCPIGPVSFLPFHAAGLYSSQDQGAKIYECVASSYMPTLSLLPSTSYTPLGVLSPSDGVLVVGPSGNNEKALTASNFEEIDALYDVIESVTSGRRGSLRRLENQSTSAVLSEMTSKAWVHLACHVRQSPLKVGEDAFLLSESQTLSLADISRLPSSKRGFAFLSACQASACVNRSDPWKEGMSLAAGMVVAGYRSVIATTSAARQSDAKIVAEAVYRRLFSRQSHSIHSTTTLALHNATQQLREKVGESEVMLWAPFVHLGF